ARCALCRSWRWSQSPSTAATASIADAHRWEAWRICAPSGITCQAGQRRSELLSCMEHACFHRVHGALHDVRDLLARVPEQVGELHDHALLERQFGERALEPFPGG